MREFFELINEYPWTTFFLIIGLGFLLEEISGALAVIIHGPKHDITIKTDDEDKE